MSQAGANKEHPAEADKRSRSEKPCGLRDSPKVVLVILTRFVLLYRYDDRKAAFSGWISNFTVAKSVANVIVYGLRYFTDFYGNWLKHIRSCISETVADRTNFFCRVLHPGQLTQILLVEFDSILSEINNGTLIAAAKPIFLIDNSLKFGCSYLMK